MRAIEVRDASQVAAARRAAVTLAQASGFDEVDAGRVAIVATEMATNLYKHGGGGHLLAGIYDDATGTGIECLALDRGQGMADVAASMRDGHSTSGTAGNGLGAIVRGSQVTDIYTAMGGGTAVLARLSSDARKSASRHDHPAYGVVSLAMAGEDVCGDGWCYKTTPSGWMAMVADGLGHGPYAAEAAHAAQRTFHSEGHRLPSELLATMHGALKPTRGAAVSIAHVNADGGEIVFAGVGNVAGVLVERGNGIRRMVSNNGTIGHIAKHMRDFRYDIGDAALLVLASDGLGTSWRLDDYPGLISHHPTLIAGVLYRDFARGRDDVTVLVCRVGSL